LKSFKLKAKWLPSGGWRAFFLLLLMLYAFMPFETESENFALQIRSGVAIFFTLYVLRSTGIFLDRCSFVLLIFALFAVAFAALVSVSGRFFVTLVSIVLAAVVSCAADRDPLFRCSLSRALEWLLVLSSMALLLQLAVWHGTGELLRIHEVFFPLSEARVEDHGEFARLGGLYIEPGTFANWSLLIFLVYRMLAYSPNPLLPFLVGGAMVASLSVWGVAAGLVIIIVSAPAALRGKPLRASLLIGLGCLAIPVIFNADVLAFIEAKTALESVSGDSKVVAVNEFMHEFDSIFLLGKGFAPNFCVGCTSPQDAGVFIGFSVTFGVLFAIIVFLALFLGVFRRLGFAGILIALFVPVSKVFYWDFIFWILVFLTWRQLSNVRKVRD
jgi:hypothetical protein